MAGLRIRLTTHMFVADDARLDVAFPVALARLEGLARDSSLAGLSRDAYGAGPGVSRLVSVYCMNLVTRVGSAILGVRWNAAAPGGVPFPALDANIILTADGERVTMLRLEGAYRPPLGHGGAQLDAAIMHGADPAAIRGFVRRMADAIAGPVGTAGTACLAR